MLVADGGLDDDADEAIIAGARDPHLERVDGQLREIVQPRRELAPLLVSRIKVMAKLDIAEKKDSARRAYFTAFSRA